MRPTYVTLLFLAAACSDRPTPKPPVTDTTVVKPDTAKHDRDDKHKKHHEGHEGDDRN